jgi:hypothetical protein
MGKILEDLFLESGECLAPGLDVPLFFHVVHKNLLNAKYCSIVSKQDFLNQETFWDESGFGFQVQVENGSKLDKK